MVGVALLCSAYMLCDIGVVRPMARPTVNETRLMARTMRPTKRMVPTPSSVRRSKTTTALLLCLSDCLKYALLALVVTGKASELYERMVELLTNRSEKKRSNCRDQRWLKRVDKHYRLWLSVCQDPSAKSGTSVAQSLRDRASAFVVAAADKGERWFFEDMDIRSVSYVQNSERRKILLVDSFMRKYALDDEGFIVVGSKDFRAVQEQLVWDKCGSHWQLVDVQPT